ncbi:unnamed protein product [Rotaria socialis]|uniref:Trafficking protein particle complex subunit n=1 Tax=Rotaria socialis TaxID=392032 RepID=A0A818EX67_9BILA|nr:unnamed protein product [Rotaria socialis]
MVVYNLYIFSRTGQCLFYREWLRRQQTNMTQDEEFKLMNGFIYSVKSFVRRLSPTDFKDGFLSYKTNCYKLHYYETLTGLKFILNTDSNVGNIRDILHQLYSTIYVNYILKNPRSSASDVITNEQEIFIEKLDEFISNLSIFSQTNKA